MDSIFQQFNSSTKKKNRSKSTPQPHISVWNRNKEITFEKFASFSAIPIGEKNPRNFINQMKDCMIKDNTQCEIFITPKKNQPFSEDILFYIFLRIFLWKLEMQLKSTINSIIFLTLLEMLDQSSKEIIKFKFNLHRSPKSGRDGKSCKKLHTCLTLLWKDQVK